MAQCKAATASGTQCVSEVVPPSRSLCKRHQNVLAGGRSVVNFETGRRFPAPVASAAPAKRAATKPAAPTRAPRRVAAAVVDEDEHAEEGQRALGEHSLMCRGPRCRNMALPGSDYCMSHQRLA